MSYTLTTLRDSVKEYTENSETTFIPHIRDFIRSAENRLFKMIDFVYFRKNATSATSSADPYLSVPTDFLSSHSISVTSSSNKIFLLEKDVNFIHEYNPNSATTGVPKYFARFDVDNFIMAPTPNSNYTTELHYYYRPTSLADSTITINVALSNSLAVGETITGGTTEASTTISSIGSDTTKTWLSKNAINAMLYGSLRSVCIHER